MRELTLKEVGKVSGGLLWLQEAWLPFGRSSYDHPTLSLGYSISRELEAVDYYGSRVCVAV